MPMKTPNEKLAAAITGYLQAFAADPNINPRDFYESKGGVMHLYHPSAVASGAKIGLLYVSFQGRSWVTVEQAEKYLAWLRDGWVGTHHMMEAGHGVKMKVEPYVEPVNEPTLIEETDHGDKRYEHPSWGLIGASRVSGSANLFGSALRHQHYIVLRIGRASLSIGDSGQEHVFSSSLRSHELVEVALSEAQFGQLLSSMNMGNGVPCTIKYVQGDQIPDCPVDKVKERFHSTVKEDVGTVTEKMRLFEEELSTRFENSKSLTKAEKKQILDKMSAILRGIDDKMPFVLKMFEEKLEQQVSAAKTEIDSFLQHKAQMLGFEVATNRVAVLGDGLAPADPDAPKLEAHFDRTKECGVYNSATGATCALSQGHNNDEPEIWHQSRDGKRWKWSSDCSAPSDDFSDN